MYFLDSNTCIDFLRHPNSPVRAHLAELPLSDIQIPAVVKGELLNGAYKSRFPETLSETERFLSYFSIVPFIDGMTYTYANIRSGLEKQGKPIGANDMLIAATALYHHATLVTHNTAEFERIPGLLLEDWNI